MKFDIKIPKMSDILHRTKYVLKNRYSLDKIIKRQLIVGNIKKPKILALFCNKLLINNA